jgi:dolichol kinase
MKRLVTWVVVNIIYSAWRRCNRVSQEYSYKEEAKHWIGNIAMLITVTPLAYYYFGIPGLITAIVASIVEKFEYKWIDDNLLIPSASLIILYLLT